jgi:hypothetical protein
MMLTSRIPRFTISRNGFLARSTALSWPWNKDRILAAPGTLPPSFADLALGLAHPVRPVIQVWCKDPVQRESAAVGTAPPVALAQARAQGTTTQSDAVSDALDPRFREDDDGRCPTAGSAQDPIQRENVPRPAIPETAAPGRCLREDDDGAASSAAKHPMQRERTGPLRNGNPRGNPNLAPRCGARTRMGCPCRAPAMRNGRCRMHGGKSTGPRTEEGRARIRAARTRHGRYSAEGRAFQRNVSDLLRRSRDLLALATQPGPVDQEALRHLAPPEFGKHPMQRETPLGIGSAAPSLATLAMTHPAVPVRWQLLLARPTQREQAIAPSPPRVGAERAGVRWGTHRTLCADPQSSAPNPAEAGSAAMR